MSSGLQADAKRGDLTYAGYENSDNGAGDPYGTALDLTSYTEARVCGEISPSFTSEEVEYRRTACGGQSGFGTQADVVNREYRLTHTFDAGYQTGMGRYIGQFLGAVTAPAEQTALQGDYLHTFTFSGVSNAFFGTFAYETSVDGVIELVSTYTESINISMSGVGQPLECSVDLVADNIEVSSPVNTNADLQSLVHGDEEVIVPTCATTFRIKEVNDDGADTALAAGDITPLVSFDLEMSRPLEVVPEATGGACNGPTESDALSGTLTVTFKLHTGNDDISYIDWLANSRFMADITFTGTQIGSGELKTFAIRLPKLVMIEAPDYAVVDEGFNEYTVVFRILDSINTMPGFTTKSPEFDLINKRSGAYLLP